MGWDRFSVGSRLVIGITCIATIGVIGGRQRMRVTWGVEGRTQLVVIVCPGGIEVAFVGSRGIIVVVLQVTTSTVAISSSRAS